MQNKLLKIVNPVLALSFLTQIASALLIEIFELPLGELHEINGYVFTALVIFHIILNWNWIKRNLLFTK
jgi:hypothetical protein